MYNDAILECEGAISTIIWGNISSALLALRLVPCETIVHARPSIALRLVPCEAIVHALL